MKVLIRTRLLAWLLGATLPIFGASLVIANEVTSRVTESASQELENLAKLEALHLRSTLVDTEASGVALAEDARLTTLLANSARTASDMNAMAEVLRGSARAGGREVAGIRITDREAAPIGEAGDFQWEVDWQERSQQSMESRRSTFGAAFRVDEGDERLGLAVPIVAPDGVVLGSLLVENNFAPLVATLNSFEEVGRTTEGVLSQVGSQDDVQIISIRRFERDSAFTSSHRASNGIPSVVSVETNEVSVLTGRDYRGVQTIAAVTRIEPVGWGLTVKIDRSEALELSNQIRWYVLAASAATLLAVLLSWLTFVRPLARRIKETSEASFSVSKGDYGARINDQSLDEIGELSRSIDRLASDLQDDIAAREGAEEKLRFQANHDDLTGLVNRQHARSLIADLHPDEVFSLLFIDLDQFKEINDTYGHTIGDEVLVTIARRLEPRLPEGSTLSRWGGDEFLVVLPGVGDVGRMAVEADLRVALDEPIATASGPQSVGMSIGGATSSNEGSNEKVLASADAEMFKRKRFRSSTVRVPSEVRQRVETALAEDRVEAFYQPVVRVNPDSGVHLAGAEALVRLRGRDGAIIPPGDFLPALGNDQLARRIDFAVIAHAVADLASWHRRAIIPERFHLAVNVGPATIDDKQLLPHLASVLKENNVSAELLVIEIPETVESVTPETLEAFRNLGVRIAIDDVGVQFSNLERMVDLQADIAKLDRRWISSMATAEVSKGDVLRSLVDQCTTLGMDIIAEGIETEDQLQMLQNLGVDVFQGFLFSRPLALFDFERVWGRPDMVSFRGVAGVDLPIAG